MKLKRQRATGFTLVEIMITVAIIGLLAAIAIPSLIRSRATSQSRACINNLRQMDDAAQQWAIETGQSDSALVTSADLVPYIKLQHGNLPGCPAGGTYSDTWTITNQPTCSIGTTMSPSHVLP